MERGRWQVVTAVRFGLGLAGLALVIAAIGRWAVPWYGNLKVQNKLAEVFVAVDACQREVDKLVRSTSAPMLSTSLFVCDGGASSGATISRYLKSIAVRATGAITVAVNHHSLPELTLATSTLTIVPMLDEKTTLRSSDVGKTILAWRCGSPEDGTTIPRKYLPSNCRP